MQAWPPLTFSSGTSFPLGITSNNSHVNFALFSKQAKKVTLGLFEPNQKEVKKEVELKCTKNPSGTIWHLAIKGLPPESLYAFKVDDQWVLDPYAKELQASTTWGQVQTPLLAKVFPQTEFNWENDKPLNLPFQELIIYEMHVRSFTKDPSSKTEHPGTFLGIIEKIPHLKELGINAVELMPVFEFTETNNPHVNPLTKEQLFKYWGYSTLNFFAPMARYGSISDFKTMVKALHKAGIEVILDVVYNHVGTDFFEKIDKQTYFIMSKGHHLDFTGCGHTVQCNHPVVLQWILSSLRHWVLDMHVDGFRFDLASIFCRDDKGHVLKHPPIIDAITADKALSQTKLIAEAWDCGGLYQVGSFPGKKRFAEWNGKYRDIVRRFLKGTPGQSADFATVICGSENLYGKEKHPYKSINFFTAHDGFTLNDLVSYGGKHNLENGEDNRDGNNTNESWNCGAEGPTEDKNIQELRWRQMHNFIIALFVSIGTPMCLMGDEYGHTRKGNNNSYCQDNILNYFLWEELRKKEELFRFFCKIIAFRKTYPHFCRTTFLTPEDITWHGQEPQKPNWGYNNHLVAYTLKNSSKQIYIAFYAGFEPIHLTIPSLENESKWTRFVDTAHLKEPEAVIDTHYYLAPYSSLILLS